MIHKESTKVSSIQLWLSLSEMQSEKKKPRRLYFERIRGDKRHVEIRFTVSNISYCNIEAV